MLARHLICFVLALSAVAQTPAKKPEQKLAPMPTRVSGPFDVKVTAVAPDTEVGKAANLGRMTIDKRFHGPLEAVSKGEMIAVQGEVKGSAGYVAMERVTGTLNGKKGSFVLQHSATMDRGKPSLFVTVVPDSGTDELKGITGWMNIVIEGTKHFYEFNFELPPPEKK
jgi:hypothetical protein